MTATPGYHDAGGEKGRRIERPKLPERVQRFSEAAYPHLDPTDVIMQLADGYSTDPEVQEAAQAFLRHDRG